MSQEYALTIKAEGEVRDKDGNLVETIPIEHTQTITAEQAAALGFPVDEDEESDHG